MGQTEEKDQLVDLYTASIDDIDAIIDFYVEVYHGNYTLPDVAIPEIVAEKIEDPGYYWLLAKCEGKIIGSVIFAIDSVNNLGKSYAAAVSKEFRGHDIMHTMVRWAIEKLTVRTKRCDAIYATTRTLSFAPQKVLENLGFVSCGIFPNVRKVETFETHGLQVYFSPQCMKGRRKTPKLLPELVDFYNIIKKDFNLEEPELIELESHDPNNKGKKIDFNIITDLKEIVMKFYDYQDREIMQKVFFPFTEPNLMFSAKDGSADFFLNFNPMDGNAMIVAYRYSNIDLRQALMWLCEEASKSGIRYLEMLVSAFYTDRQRMALDAQFLPCAYFPAMRMNIKGEREDFFVFSRSFEKLDFMDLHLVDNNRLFLDTFMKCWYNLKVRCQPVFEEWRIG